jgi:hypothetical protein
MFTASKGQGAYLNEQRIRTTNTRGFENTLISLPATTLPVSKYLSRPEKSPIKPPASLTKSAPAAMSIGYHLFTDSKVFLSNICRCSGLATRNFVDANFLFGRAQCKSLLGRLWRE